jgi:membrane protein
MNPKALWALVKQAGYDWYDDKAPRLGAALAYYSIFSIAPLLILVIAIAGLWLGPQGAQNDLVQEIKQTVGEDSGNAIQDMIRHASDRHAGIIATVVAVVVLLVGASGVFGALQDALNTIWKVTPKPGRPVLGFIKDRFLSFTMVLGTGFLLLVSLILTAVLEAVAKYISPTCLSGGLCLWQVVNAAVSFGIITLLFALIFKVLPDVILTWKDVWIGAAVTALLFTLGKYLIGVYLGRAGVASYYGAAGSMVVILVWVYYSAQILLFGAEFARVHPPHARRLGRPGRECDSGDARRAGPPGNAALRGRRAARLNQKDPSDHQDQSAKSIRS